MIGGYGERGHAFESRAPFLFIFQLENILRSNLIFSTSYGPPHVETVWTSLLCRLVKYNDIFLSYGLLKDIFFLFSVFRYEIAGIFFPRDCCLRDSEFPVISSNRRNLSIEFHRIRKPVQTNLLESQEVKCVSFSFISLMKIQK